MIVRFFPAFQLRPAEAKTICEAKGSMAMLEGDGAVDPYAIVAGQHRKRSIDIGEYAKKNGLIWGRKEWDDKDER